MELLSDDAAKGSSRDMAVGRDVKFARHECERGAGKSRWLVLGLFFCRGCCRRAFDLIISAGEMLLGPIRPTRRQALERLAAG